jgi:hypothetical protein
MTEHLPECPYSAPCPAEWRNAQTIKAEGLPVPHRIVSGSSGRCVECDAGDCICYETRQAFAAGVQAAHDAVDNALRPGAVGRLTALAAIDALKQ